TVEIVKDRPLVSYRLDKKIIDVSGLYSAVSGSAVDILENVPSISVDIDGNVELRGSSSFTVLIDGRPTVLDANDALQQTPANVIARIEIITNPSAKYEPDGDAGIINIITKKRLLEGVSGIVNTSGGLYNNRGGDFLIGYRTRRMNASLGANYVLRSFPGTVEATNTTTFNDTTTSIISNGTSLFQMNRVNVRGELAVDLTEHDVVSVSFRVGEMSYVRGSDLDFTEDIDPGSSIADYLSSSLTDRNGRFVSLNGGYKHTFAVPGHEINSRISFSSRGGDDLNTTELLSLAQVITQGRKITETGPSNRVRAQVDYTRPLSEGMKFEAGYQGRMGASNDETGLAEYDATADGYIDQPDFANSVNYIRNIHALYAQFASESEKAGIQVGLRGEYTDRKISLPSIGDTFTIDRWDLFPSLHTSYQLTQQIQMLGSYSLRIRRPRSWFLEPFITWSDARNVRSGNPDLKPTYINSFELSLQLPLGKNMVTVEVYRRLSKNVTERIRTVYDTNVMLTRPENVGESRSVGTELMLNLRQIQWWNVNLIGTIFNYQLDGSFGGKDYSRSSDNWSVRLNQTFRLGQSSRIQVNSRFTSPSVSAQGERAAVYTTSVALRQSFLDRRLSITMQLGDIFKTQKQEITTSGAGFEYYSLSTRRSPSARITLSYNFNRFKESRERPNGNGEGQEDDF
ncbi:MAG: TonB-dependent receptor, partial [Candidatus Marinimicrobia bacterium]|nr:TonB-dependent receptor [Candidatus Neomarinimicrobiota bacterium]